MPLKGEVGGQYLIVMEIILLIMENHEIVFLNFCGNPAIFGILLRVVKMPLKGEIGGQYLIVMEITLLIMENHGIVFLNFCGNPVIFSILLRVVKMLLKGEVGGRALNIHGNYIVDYGKIIEFHFCISVGTLLYALFTGDKLPFSYQSVLLSSALSFAYFLR